MKNSRSLVSIVIVNWNGKRWLQRCLPSLSKVTYKAIEWVIVDNASTDGSQEWIQKHYPTAILIKNKKNVGFSQGNNIGFKKTKGKYILFLNNDTTVETSFIEELLKPFERDPTIGGVQSKIILMDDHTRVDSIGAFLTPTGFLFHNHLGKKDNKYLNKEIELYTAKGASMMFRREVLKKVSMHGWVFDPVYFAYFEETDLCHRVWLAGYRIVYAYKAVIYHKLAASSSQLISSWVQFNSYKNRINSYLKNLGIFSLFFILPIHLFLCHILVIVFFIKGNTSWAIAIFKAVWWNVFQLQKTLRYRKFVQMKIRSRADSTFFPSIVKYPSMAFYVNFLTKFLRVYTH